MTRTEQIAWQKKVIREEMKKEGNKVILKQAVENRYGNRIEAGDRISGAARDGITDDTKAVQGEAEKNENKST